MGVPYWDRDVPDPEHPLYYYCLLIKAAICRGEFRGHDGRRIASTPGTYNAIFAVARHFKINTAGLQIVYSREHWKDITPTVLEVHLAEFVQKTADMRKFFDTPGPVVDENGTILEERKILNQLDETDTLTQESEEEASEEVAPEKEVESGIMEKPTTKGIIEVEEVSGKKGAPYNWHPLYKEVDEEFRNHPEKTRKEIYQSVAVKYGVNPESLQAGHIRQKKVLPPERAVLARKVWWLIFAGTHKITKACLVVADDDEEKARKIKSDYQNYYREKSLAEIEKEELAAQSAFSAPSEITRPEGVAVSTNSAQSTPHVKGETPEEHSTSKKIPSRDSLHFELCLQVRDKLLTGGSQGEKGSGVLEVLSAVAKESKLDRKDLQSAYFLNGWSSLSEKELQELKKPAGHQKSASGHEEVLVPEPTPTTLDTDSTNSIGVVDVPHTFSEVSSVLVSPDLPPKKRRPRKKRGSIRIGTSLIFKVLALVADSGNTLPRTHACWIVSGEVSNVSSEDREDYYWALYDACYRYEKKHGLPGSGSAISQTTSPDSSLVKRDELEVPEVEIRPESNGFKDGSEQPLVATSLTSLVDLPSSVVPAQKEAVAALTASIVAFGEAEAGYDGELLMVDCEISELESRLNALKATREGLQIMKDNTRKLRENQIAALGFAKGLEATRGSTQEVLTAEVEKV